MITIPKQIIPEKYVCEICGRTSTDKEIIERCEKKGIASPLVKEGDIIYFTDCEETPIYYNLFHKEGWKNTENEDLYKHMVRSLTMGTRGLSWKVGRILKNGHDFEYHLTTQRDQMLYFSPWYGSTSTWRYPIIESNELMQKILDLYNS